MATINHKLRIRNALKRIEAVREQDAKEYSQTGELSRDRVRESNAMIERDEGIVFENAEHLTIDEFYSVCGEVQTWRDLKEEWAGASINDYCRKGEEEEELAEPEPEPVEPVTPKGQKGRPATGFGDEASAQLALKKLKRKAVQRAEEWLKGDIDPVQAWTTINQIRLADESLIRDVNNWMDRYLSPEGRTKLKASVRQTRHQKGMPAKGSAEPREPIANIQLKLSTARALKTFAQQRGLTLDEAVRQLIVNI